MKGLYHKRQLKKKKKKKRAVMGKVERRGKTHQVPIVFSGLCL
jgi:hypothetical protein